MGCVMNSYIPAFAMYVFIQYVLYVCLEVTVRLLHDKKFDLLQKNVQRMCLPDCFSGG